MIEAIRELVQTAPDIEVARFELTRIFKEVKRHPGATIGFVSGIVTSDGPEHIARNLQTLSAYAHQIRRGGLFGPNIISPADVFNIPLIAKFDNLGAKESDYLKFWRELLRSRLIDFVFMTPGWKRSQGATQEYIIAKQLHLNILSINLGGIITPVRINKPSIMPASLTA